MASVPVPEMAEVGSSGEGVDVVSESTSQKMSGESVPRTIPAVVGCDT